MVKIKYLVFILVLFGLIFAGCSANNQDVSDNKIEIVSDESTSNATQVDVVGVDNESDIEIVIGEDFGTIDDDVELGDLI